MNKRRSGRRYWFETPDGETVRGYTLFDRDGHWMGFVTLEYNDRECWGRLYSVTDYGNYGYLWNAIGEKGFIRFLLSNADDYLTGKLALGHDEADTLKVEETQVAIRECFSAEYGQEDADWLGEAIVNLEDCQCEADFYDWAEAYQVADVYRQFVWGRGRYLDGYRDRLLPELKRVLWMEVETK